MNATARAIAVLAGLAAVAYWFVTYGDGYTRLEATTLLLGTLLVGIGLAAPSWTQGGLGGRQGGARRRRIAEQAASSPCRLFHRWSKWIVSEQNMMLPGLDRASTPWQGIAKWKDRVCHRCGDAESRLVKTNLIHMSETPEELRRIVERSREQKRGRRTRKCRVMHRYGSPELDEGGRLYKPCLRCLHREYP